MPPLPLTPSAQRLAINLSHPPAVPTDQAGQMLHVADIGATFYFAYEQLRNMAENREHHLLLRSAIERYLQRYVRLDHLEPFAQELVMELTQAGYLKNNSVSLGTIAAIDQLLVDIATLSAESKWLIQYASVKIESLISPDHRTAAFMQFAYEHYLTAINRGTTLSTPVSDQDYRIALFCAIQSTIFNPSSHHALPPSIPRWAPYLAAATQFSASTSS
jgi:hypothetical protein